MNTGKKSTALAPVPHIDPAQVAELARRNANQSTEIVNPSAVGDRAQEVSSGIVRWVKNSPAAVQVAAFNAALIFAVHPHWWMVKAMAGVTLAAALKDAVMLTTKKKDGE